MVKNKKLNIRDINIFKKKIYITKTANETRNIGNKFFCLLKKGDIVFLNGNLGSGKTTFVQGIIRSFSKNKFAKSPSFLLAKEYNIKKIKFYHIDLYRLEKIDNINIDIIYDYIYSNNISIIEWANKLINFKYIKTWDITIDVIGSNRKITIKKRI
jgi:tRNA threonylcarbamoyladenosine biosynthesis protein TsaE